MTTRRHLSLSANSNRGNTNSNLSECAEVLFGQDACLAQRFVATVLSMGEAYKALHMASSSHCPLMRTDVLTIIGYLDSKPDLSSHGVNAADLAAMKAALANTLHVDNSLIDSNGRLTKTLHRCCALYDQLDDVVELIPGHRFDRLHDVHFMDGQRSSPDILFAQAKFTDKHQPSKRSRFFGLSCSLSSPLLAGSMELLETHKIDNEWGSKSTSLKRLIAQHPDHRLMVLTSWKVMKGASIGNATDWIVDQDGPNHATIATKRDLPLPAFFWFANGRKAILPPFLADFNWTADEHVHFVKVPKDIRDEMGILPLSTKRMLSNMLQCGTYEDALSVMKLQDALAARAVNPTEQYYQLSLAYRTIGQFSNSIEFEGFEEPLRLALESLAALTHKVCT